ncbi:hypothetical protein BC828DRAFT_333679, partial [Blastocladiella britannica]
IANHENDPCPLPRLCYNCNTRGHITRDCTQARVPMTCLYCMKPDHFARNCPWSPCMACFTCDKEGHMDHDCPE